MEDVISLSEESVDRSVTDLLVGDGDVRFTQRSGVGFDDLILVSVEVLIPGLGNDVDVDIGAVDGIDAIDHIERLDIQCSHC